MSEELHVNKSLGCYHLDKLESPSIKVIDYGKGKKGKLEINSNILLIVLKGSGKISFRKFVDKPVANGDILLLPIHTVVRFKVEEESSILVFKLQPSIHFCDHFSLEALFERQDKRERRRYIALQSNQRIISYTKSLVPCLLDGLQCKYFLDLKIKELFFILRAYNTRADLSVFFSPMMTEDADFYAFVLANYQSARTVGELAKKARYSVTGFERRFKKIFGVSAHTWLKEQMSANLFHEITCTRKSFYEIGKLFGFSSSAHLSNFCKLSFGVSPSTLRKKGTGKSEDNE